MQKARVIWRLVPMVCALVLGAGLAAAQQTSTTLMKTFEVVAVNGDQVVVRLPEGTREMTVPDDFRFIVNGQPLSVLQLKQGMKGTATITTQTTITPVTVTEVKNGTVVQATAGSIIVRTPEGVVRQFTQRDVDKRGVMLMVDGKPAQVSDLRAGDKLTATIITSGPAHVMTQREVQATLAAAPAAPAAPVGAPTPTSPPQQVPAATPAPAPPPQHVPTAPKKPSVIVHPAPASGHPTPSLPPKWNIKEHFDEVDGALNQLIAGNVAFNPPSRMTFRESRTMALIVSPKLSAEGLGNELRQRLGGREPIVVDSLAIGPVMEARLEGEELALNVTPLTPERQPVGSDSSTEWRWMVRADEEGKHALHLSMDAIITIEGQPYPRSLRVFDRDIEVESTMFQRMTRFHSNNWQWELGTIGLPLGLWWWRRRSRDKNDPMAPLTGRKSGGSNAAV